jgi:non-specific serine/threonine protein kinase
MLETIREDGRDRLEAAGEEADARGRHATWCLDLAERAEPELIGPEQARWLASLDAEHDNLRAALGWAIGRRDAVTAMRLGGALFRFWDTRGYYVEGRRWLEQALALDSGAATSVRAKALLGVGRIAYRQGDYDRVTALEESQALFRVVGDLAGLADSLGYLGVAVADQGDHARAAALEGEALALYRVLGDRTRVGMILNSRGLGELDQGNIEEAAALLEEALAVAREQGARHTIASALNNLALVAQAEGDFERAAALQEEALAEYRLLGNQDGLAHCFENLALIAAARNDPERAVRLFGATETLRTRIGAPGRRSDRETNARVIADARARLGEAVFAATWESGRSLSIDAAIAYALGHDEEMPRREDEC